MCMGGGGGGYVPPPKPRWLQDTSNEIIVSKYELSEANKAKNARIRASLLRRTSQAPRVESDGGGDDWNPTPTGGGKKASDQGTGGIRDAMQNAYNSQTTGDPRGSSSFTDTNNDGIQDWGI